MAEAGEGAGVLNWRRVDDRLTTSGQPDAAQLAALADDGVTCVINLGLADHPKAVAGEAEILARHGARYVNIPVAFDAPQEGDYRRFLAAMDDAAGERVHVHCIVNARVCAFLYRRDREAGAPEAEARARMETVWRPGGVWARFIGDAAREGEPHAYAGRDYPL